MQAAADLVGAGAAGLAAVQAFRSQLPQDAAEYVRMNVLPRPGPQPQPPPQIIGRPDDVERLLDEAGQRAQEVERGAAQAIEETAAVAAEELPLPLRAPLGTWGPGRRSSSPRTHGGRGCWSDGCHGRSRRGGNVGLAGGAAYGLARGTGWVLENTLFRPQQGSEDAAVQDVRSANNMNDATQPQHFTLRSGSSTSGSPEPCDSAPVPAELPGKLPQLRTPEPPASAELRPAGPRWPRLSFAVRAKMSVALHVKKHGGSHSRSTG